VIKTEKSDSNKVHGNKGQKLSDEHKKKLSASHKGKTPWNKGKVGVYTKKTRKKMSKSHLGFKHSQKTKQKISNYVKHNLPSTAFKKGQTSWIKGKKRPDISGKNHPLFRKHPSKETRQKMSDAKKGKHLVNSGQFQKNQKPWITGKHHTEETRKKLSESNKGKIPWQKGKKLPERSGKNHHLYGKHHTEEALEKIRVARAKQIFPSQDTKPERIIQIALSLEQIQFQKHNPFKMKSGSYHQVDLFIEPNLCIEIDGCYWHSCKRCGFDYPPRIEKDRIINESLQSQGMKVIRIWEHEIKESMDRCIERVKKSAMTI